MIITISFRSDDEDNCCCLVLCVKIGVFCIDVGADCDCSSADDDYLSKNFLSGDCR